jgi:hypothetical protein
MAKREPLKGFVLRNVIFLERLQYNKYLSEESLDVYLSNHLTMRITIKSLNKDQIGQMFHFGMGSMVLVETRW